MAPVAPSRTAALATSTPFPATYRGDFWLIGNSYVLEPGSNYYQDHLSVVWMNASHTSAVRLECRTLSQ
jgi:hypothetical protein